MSCFTLDVEALSIIWAQVVQWVLFEEYCYGKALYLQAGFTWHWNNETATTSSNNYYEHSFKINTIGQKHM